MNICAKCKYSFFSFKAPFGYICSLTKGEQNPVTGGHSFEKCETINTKGKCPDYEELQSFWQKIKKKLKL